MGATGAGQPADADRLMLACRLEDLDAAADWLAGIARRDGWPDDVLTGADLALSEWLSNLIMHGAGGGAIELSHRREGAHALIVVRDPGPPFDPTAQADAELPTDIETARIGGLGIHLMRNFLAEMRYRRDGEINELTMVTKPVGQGRSVSSPGGSEPS